MKYERPTANKQLKTISVLNTWCISRPGKSSKSSELCVLGVLRPLIAKIHEMNHKILNTVKQRPNQHVKHEFLIAVYSSRISWSPQDDMCACLFLSVTSQIGLRNLNQILSVERMHSTRSTLAWIIWLSKMECNRIFSRWKIAFFFLFFFLVNMQLVMSHWG